MPLASAPDSTASRSEASIWPSAQATSTRGAIETATQVSASTPSSQSLPRTSSLWIPVTFSSASRASCVRFSFRIFSRSFSFSRAKNDSSSAFLRSPRKSSDIDSPPSPKAAHCTRPGIAIHRPRPLERAGAVGASASRGSARPGSAPCRSRRRCGAGPRASPRSLPRP